MLSRTTGFGIRLVALLMVAGIDVCAPVDTSGAVLNGTVVGTVEAVEGNAVLPELAARLVFSGSGGEYESHVDKHGRYQISLPAPDVYKVRIGFFNCVLTRAAFHLRPGEKLELRFAGVNCPTWEPKPPPNWQMERNKVPPLQNPSLCSFEDEIPVWYREQRLEADPSTHRPEIVISFERCEENPKRVTYFHLDPSLLPFAAPKAAGDLSLPAAITCEAFTIRADKITRPGRGFTFYASGNVTVEDGKGHVIHAQSAILSFARGKPTV